MRIMPFLHLYIHVFINIRNFNRLIYRLLRYARLYGKDAPESSCDAPEHLSLCSGVLIIFEKYSFFIW